MSNNLMKQGKVWQSWGRFSLAASQVAILSSTLTLIMVIINAYNPVSQWLSQHGLNMPFWVFLAIILIPLLLAYLFSWKYLVASFYNSSTSQFWKQSKELTDMLTKRDDELKELINKRFDALEKK